MLRCLPITHRQRKLAWVLCLIAAPFTVSATPPPTSTNPALIEQRFEQKPAARSSGKVEAPPGAPPTVIPTGIYQQLAETRFVLRRVIIEGATLYTPEELKDTYDDMLGEEISLLDAKTIAWRITNRYREDYYVLSQASIPPQTIRDGTLMIHVIEGFVGSATIVGSAQTSAEQRLLDAYGQRLTSKRPVNIADLERYLLLLNDLPGVGATGAVHLSPTQFGAVDLITNTARRPYDAYASIDNRGSKYVGPLQYTFGFTANSLFGRYDRTHLRAITASPSSELRFIDLQHDEPLGGDGARVSVGSSFSDTVPGDALKSSNIRGQSLLVQTKISYPFIRTRHENANGRIVLDLRNTTTDAAGNAISKDSLRTMRVGGRYDFVDSLLGVNLIDAQISRGLNIWNASDSGAIRSRADGESNFTKLNVDLARTQNLPHNFTLAATATAQYTTNRLLAAENFTVGGASFGSAYDPSELAGDIGAAAKAELRYNQHLGYSYLSSLQPYGYYDFGYARINDGGADAQTLASAGIGVRGYFNSSLYGNIEAALPLTRPASNQGNHGNDPRVFFGLTNRF